MFDFESKVRVVSKNGSPKEIEYYVVVNKPTLSLDEIVEIGKSVSKDCQGIHQRTGAETLLLGIGFGGQDFMYIVIVDLDNGENCVLKELIMAYRLDEAEQIHKKFLEDVRSQYGGVVADFYNFDEMYDVLVAKKTLEAERDFCMATADIKRAKKIEEQIEELN